MACSHLMKGLRQGALEAIQQAWSQGQRVEHLKSTRRTDSSR